MKELTLKFEIKLGPGMVLTSMWVHMSHLNRKQLNDFKTSSDPDVVKGEIKITIFSNSISFDISGVGTHANIKGSFNFTLNDKKVFKDDQELIVESPYSRISYTKENVTLPI